MTNSSKTSIIYLDLPDFDNVLFFSRKSFAKYIQNNLNTLHEIQAFNHIDPQVSGLYDNFYTRKVIPQVHEDCLVPVKLGNKVVLFKPVGNSKNNLVKLYDVVDSKFVKMFTQEYERIVDGKLLKFSYISLSKLNKRCRDFVGSMHVLTVNLSAGRIKRLSDYVDSGSNYRHNEIRAGQVIDSLNKEILQSSGKELSANIIGSFMFGKSKSLFTHDSLVAYKENFNAKINSKLAWMNF